MGKGRGPKVRLRLAGIPWTLACRLANRHSHLQCLRQPGSGVPDEIPQREGDSPRLRIERVEEGFGIRDRSALSRHVQEEGSGAYFGIRGRDYLPPRSFV